MEEIAMTKLVERYRQQNCHNLKGILLTEGDIVEIIETKNEYIEGTHRVISISDTNVLTESLNSKKVCRFKTDDIFELVS